MANQNPNKNKLGPADIKFLYHVTKRENLDDITRNGLKAAIGGNSRSVNEDEATVFLCRENDVAVWQTILGVDGVAIVNMKGLMTPECRNMGFGSEFLYHGDIPAANITVRPEKAVLLDNTLQRLCWEYLLTVSDIAMDAARLARLSLRDELDDGDMAFCSAINEDIDTLLPVLRRIDFKKMLIPRVTRKLKQLARDGECTLCDTWLDTDERCWEQIKKLETTGARELDAWIRENLAPILTVDTGTYGV